MPSWVVPAVAGLLSLIVVGSVVWSYRATRKLGGAEKEVEVLHEASKKQQAAQKILAMPIPLGRNLRARLRKLAGRDPSAPVSGVD
jgi:hypothetical protein